MLTQTTEPFRSARAAGNRSSVERAIEPPAYTRSYFFAGSFLSARDWALLLGGTIAEEDRTQLLGAILERRAAY
jgi:hypothetical protein